MYFRNVIFKIPWFIEVIFEAQRTLDVERDAHVRLINTIEELRASMDAKQRIVDELRASMDALQNETKADRRALEYATCQG